MKKVLKYKRIYLLSLMPLSYLLIFAARKSSFFAEQIYAKHIYKWISQIISTITGIVPFSLAEILVIALPVLVLTVSVRFILRMILDKKDRKERLLKGILNVFCSISIILFLFVTLAGMNYYRYPFTRYSNLEIRNSSVQELYLLTKSLAKTANDLRAKVPETDKAGVFKLSMNNYESARYAAKAYNALTKEYPILSGSYGEPKPVFFSKLMSQTEITGIFMPFTMEANVNVDIPDYNIPVTMLHELAHLRGFMREDEANYLAYLAGMKSDNVEFQYSSTMLALITAGNALYNQSHEKFEQIYNTYSDGVIKDMRENNQYWTQFDNKVVSTVSNKINDTYLKANNQTDGVKSYGRMLDLLLAKYRKDHQ